jgi:Porin subfamily
MRMTKSLILSSVACLIAVGGAQAADLPTKAKAIEYVRICSLYGAGFYYMPGTDTCIKLGGYLRVDATFNGGGTQDRPAWDGDNGAGDRYRDYFDGRARMQLSIDTRTATEYGILRTFGQGDFTFDTLAATRNPNNLATNLGNNTNLLSTSNGGYLIPENLFIQFVGFTFGKSTSAFASPWNGYPGNTTSHLLGGHDSTTGVNNVQYSMQFGSGVSATVGLDDGVVYNRTSLYNLSTGLTAIGLGATAYGGLWAPDVVGNIRVDQAWGMFQISGGGHEVNGSFNALTAGTGQSVAASELSGHPGSKWGGAVMAALQIRNLPTGPGDDIKLDTTYTKGDTKNVISTSSASPSPAMYGGTSRAGAYQSIGFGATTDGVWLPVANGGTGDIKLTSAYGVRGAFNHNWDPYWSSSLFGSASAVRYEGSAGDLTSAMGQYCAAYKLSNPGAKSADYSCNPDFNVYQLGLVTRWTPVKNFTFAGEVMWTRLDQNFTGTSVLAPSAPKPTTIYQYKDQDTVSFNLRVQRNF